MAKRVQQVAEVVKKVLEEHPKTRDNDNALICWVLNEYKVGAFNLPFIKVMQLIQDGTFPTMESITRARRKAQELYPNLRASEEVETYRINKTAEYIRFSQDERI